jgi:hypothetical protein
MYEAYVSTHFSAFTRAEKCCSSALSVDVLQLQYLLTYGAEPFLRSCQLCSYIYGTNNNEIDLRA